MYYIYYTLFTLLDFFGRYWTVQMVPGAGVEPARPYRARDFKSLASTNSATRADKLEARTGIEPVLTALQAAASPLCHLAL